MSGNVVTHQILQIVGHGERAGSATAVVLPTLSCRLVCIKAQSGNAGNVYLGNSSAVTVAGGDTDTTTGIELDAGQEIWLEISNLNQLYMICNNAGDDITYIGFG